MYLSADFFLYPSANCFMTIVSNNRNTLLEYCVTLKYFSYLTYSSSFVVNSMFHRLPLPLNEQKISSSNLQSKYPLSHYTGKKTSTPTNSGISFYSRASTVQQCFIPSLHLIQIDFAFDLQYIHWWVYNW